MKRQKGDKRETNGDVTGRGMSGDMGWEYWGWGGGEVGSGFQSFRRTFGLGNSSSPLVGCGACLIRLHTFQPHLSTHTYTHILLRYLFLIIYLLTLIYCLFDRHNKSSYFFGLFPKVPHS